MSPDTLEDADFEEATLNGPSPVDDASTENEAQSPGRTRSTIGFPYGSLKDAEQITQELQDKWGGSASPEQLAGGLDQQPRSGAFRMKVATARTFGVIHVSRGNVRLAPLGRRIIDRSAQASARVEAFKTVPLFNALLEEYKGSLLPPDAGLERKIVDLGVSGKQASKARQAFQRSAELAGFFQHGRNRLVEPSAGVASSGKPPKLEDHKERNAGMSSQTAPITTVPFPDLWLTLLNEGRTWSAEKTQEFVQKARELQELLAKD